MKTNCLKIGRHRAWSALGLAGLLAGGHAAPALAEAVPVRLSIKFILNSAGNRPAAGNINTDAEVNAQVDRGNQILANWISELRIQKLEILEVADDTHYFDTASTADRDSLRDDAIADPDTYHWRNDCINIYIVGSANVTAISDFPANNNIILMGQGSFDTTMIHEIGHSLNLIHTHETAGSGNDQCSDTLVDDEDWTRDQVAQNAYGNTYANLTVGQKYNVDMTFSNVMSYHNPDDRSMLSPCQLDRESTQGYADRSWLLSKTPVYVDAAASGTQNGSFVDPYQNVQQAINGGLNNRVLVIDTGTHANPSSAITTATEVVPRKGTATIQEMPVMYQLANVENSTNQAVRAAVLRAQASDRQKDIAGVIASLQEAEQFATGREKLALQIELAQRNRDTKRLDEAATWFQKAADGADQPKLRQHAVSRVAMMKEKALREREAKANLPKDENPNR